jgi:hypothetical protein
VYGFLHKERSVLVGLDIMGMAHIAGVGIVIHGERRLVGDER